MERIIQPPLALTPGSRLGVYEITASLGAGGMGQVYRATDTTLGRQVAIKILPDAFAADPDRLARFEREAKTLASLNHPNIAQIYGFERGPAEAAGDGPAKAGHYIGANVASGFSRTSALVMELVVGEGRTAPAQDTWRSRARCPEIPAPLLRMPRRPPAAQERRRSS